MLLYSRNVVFTTRGMSQPYRVDMIFWGSILRKQDLQPQMLSPGKEISKVLVLEPSKLLGVVQSKAWQLGVIVDKPVISLPDGEAVLPNKFLTRRVEVDDAVPEAIPGIPDAPRIPLRMPRQ